MMSMQVKTSLNTRRGSARRSYRRVSGVMILGVVLLLFGGVGCGRKGPLKPLKSKPPVEIATTYGMASDGLPGRSRYSAVKETKVVQAIVTGATGRMGRRLIALMQDDPACTLVGAVAYATHRDLGRDAGDVAGVGQLGVRLQPDLSGCLAASDVVIDFSVADASLEYLRQVTTAGKAMVIGTTGFTAQQRQEIARLSQAGPCLLAPNMSVGVQVIFQLLRQATALLGSSYDVEIIEAHHRTKVDAPSGTALRMGEIVAETRKQTLDDTAVYGRQGPIGRRSDTEIGIQAIRGGDIVGEHTIIFAGTGERIELVHRSQSRDNFVRGALRAAQWIVTQLPGLYSIEDMLRTV